MKSREGARIRWDSPLVVALFLAFAVALHAPSLGWGFFADDWGHRLVLEEPAQHATLRPWSLYDFGDVASNQVYFEDALFPWWTDPAWKARFFRPVSSCVLWLDHALLGRNAPAHHALGLLWHGAFLFLAWRLYRAAGLGPGLALLALALLALEDGAAMTVGWIANRNSLVEGVFTAGALLCSLRARARGGAWPMLAALALGVLAAGSKESGLAALLGCAVLLGTSARTGVRWSGLAALLLALAHLGFLLLAGYGTRCLFYPTPWGEPGRWAKHLAGLLTAGPLTTLAPFPVDALLLVPGGYWPLVALCGGLLAPLVRPFVSAVRALALGPHFAWFALVALIPQASAPPSDRLLYVPALGLAPLSALMLGRLLARTDASSRPGRRLGWVVVVCALPLSAVALFLRGTFMGGVARDLGRVFELAELDPAPPARRDVFVLQSPTVLIALSPLSGWRFHRGDRHTRFHALQFGRRALAWRGIDAHTFELESRDEAFLDALFEGVFLASTPLRRGTVHRTSGGEVELVDEAPLRTLRVRCPEPLTGERFVFLAWSEGRWRRRAPPAPGETILLERGLPLRPLMP